MMQVARHVGRQFYFMAAYHVFNARGGLDGWVMQRLGAFSIDREGVDRRAMRTASELLGAGKCLVLFPEGEVYRLNERLTPILEGPAFIAAAAQRAADDAGGGRRVWVVPAAIQYSQSRDVSAELDAAMTRLETRMFWSKPPAGATTHQRIVRFGEMLLTLKEKEKLGRSAEDEADLPTRIARLIETLLARHESEYVTKSTSADTVPLRVKAVRRCLLDIWTDEAADPAARRRAGDALDDVQLVLQLFSYPGDYVVQRPTPERMAETIEKFEQDVFGRVRPIGRRRARVLLGEPIDMAHELRSSNRRTVVADVTERLEQSIDRLVRR
jgi:hypothetical protein